RVGGGPADAEAGAGLVVGHRGGRGGVGRVEQGRVGVCGRARLDVAGLVVGERVEAVAVVAVGRRESEVLGRGRGRVGLVEHVAAGRRAVDTELVFGQDAGPI